MITKIVEGSLLEAQEPYIAQQCNFVTVRSHGLSKLIAKEFPYADVYGMREKIGRRNCCTDSDRAEPGSIMLFEPPGKGPIVISLFSQFLPGKPGRYKSSYTNPNNYKDNKNERLQWFRECLEIIDDDPEINEVALPYGIGCGLAGGNWDDYEKAIRDAKTNFVLYRLS